jgi:PcRGLX-like protein central beta sandwich domain/PcRGLX-like N-terminal RIFT barrel domain
MSRKLLSLLLGFAAVVLCGAAGAVEVKLTVEDAAKVARKGEAVTTGVPFARGVLKDVSKLSVSAGGKKVPAQFTKTVPWDDGSVRWALLDTQVDLAAGGKTTLTVSDSGGGIAPASPVKVDDGADAVKVSTGPLEFVVSKKKFNLFESLKVGGKELLTAKGKGLVLVTAGGKEVVAGAPEEVTLEHAGPMKVIVKLQGKFGSVHRGLLHYTVRITAYAGQKYIKVHTWLENQGKYGYTGKKEWFNFDGMRIDLGLGLGGEISAACEGASAKGKLKVEQVCTGGHRYAELKYTVKSGAKELKSGARTNGVVALSGSGGKLNVAIRHFWQNYEKAIELDGAALKLWLWPTDGQWPRSVKRGASTGEMGQFCKQGLYALPGGVHKGYEAILDFSGRDAAASAATVSSPLMAKARPAYYASTLASVGWFAPMGFQSGADAKYDGVVKAWDKMAMNAVDPAHKASLISAAKGPGEKRGFWFGWMDYGDLYWQPGAASLHYDWTWIMMLNFLRSGQRGFLDLGTAMARHRIDVDQIWSDRSASYFRGLTRYEKGYTNIHGGVKSGYYKPIPSHHWNQGVAVYYMLTGEEKAKECALRSAMGVKLRTVDKFAKKPSAGGQLRSAGWSLLVLCSAYDLTADKKYLDQALSLFKNNIVPKWKAKGPYMDGGLQYYYSVYPMAMLHHRTGDAEVLKLLREGVAKDSFSYRYGEWTIHINNLYAYVGMVDKKPAAIKKAQDLFNQYAPRGANPGVYNGNGAWTKEQAKHLRYGHLLQYIHWKGKGGK